MNGKAPSNNKKNNDDDNNKNKYFHADSDYSDNFQYQFQLKMAS